jgi:hypothetical protein
VVSIGDWLMHVSEVANPAVGGENPCRVLVVADVVGMIGACIKAVEMENDGVCSKAREGEREVDVALFCFDDSGLVHLGSWGGGLDSVRLACCSHFRGLEGKTLSSVSYQSSSRREGFHERCFVGCSNATSASLRQEP